MKPFVLWFTGFSGSGKSTLAAQMADYFREQELACEILDGDVVREAFPQIGFSREERNEHIRRMGFVASLLERNGVRVLASFISPYEESRRYVRRTCRNYIEVHLSPPLDWCERHDVKGFYRRARAGEIKGFTGIDDPYEPPLSPELRIDTSLHDMPESLRQIREYLVGRGFLPAACKE